MPAPLKPVVEAWIESVNEASLPSLMSLYHVDAVHERANGPALIGSVAIRHVLEDALKSRPVIKATKISEVGSWALLEWAGPGGASMCTLFQVENGRIALTRGLDSLLESAKETAPPASDVWELT